MDEDQIDEVSDEILNDIDAQIDPEAMSMDDAILVLEQVQSGVVARLNGLKEDRGDFR